MKTRFLHGTTEQNNRLLLPEGRLAVDTEKKAVRLHDGVTPGGFEIVGTRAFDPGPSPGPQELIAGDLNHGFYGEVPFDEVITGMSLAAEIGLSEGTVINEKTNAWLKFALDGKVLFVAKKPLRYEISWNAIYAAGAVYGMEGPGIIPALESAVPETDQTAQVAIESGHRFKVRLMTGAISDPFPYTSRVDDSEYAGGEWNALMYPIFHQDPEERYWATYTDIDLGIRAGLGQINWCQEAMPYGSDGPLSHRIGRGTHDSTGSGRITRFDPRPATFDSVAMGWRPVLELIP